LQSLRLSGLRRVKDEIEISYQQHSFGRCEIRKVYIVIPINLDYVVMNHL